MTDYLDENIFEDQILKMLHYNRIDINAETDLAKSSKSKRCKNCHYNYFF